MQSGNSPFWCGGPTKSTPPQKNALTREKKEKTKKHKNTPKKHKNTPKRRKKHPTFFFVLARGKKLPSSKKKLALLVHPDDQQRWEFPLCHCARFLLRSATTFFLTAFFNAAIFLLRLFSFLGRIGEWPAWFFFWFSGCWRALSKGTAWAGFYSSIHHHQVSKPKNEAHGDGGGFGRRCGGAASKPAPQPRCVWPDTTATTRGKLSTHHHVGREHQRTMKCPKPHPRLPQPQALRCVGIGSRPGGREGRAWRARREARSSGTGRRESRRRGCPLRGTRR